jgi:hypothetical protein
MSLKESEISAAYCELAIDLEQAPCRLDELNFATGLLRGYSAAWSKSGSSLILLLILHNLLRSPQLSNQTATEG